MIDVQTNKSIADQRDTAIRVRYPQLHKRPEWVLLLSTFEVLYLLGPFLTFVAGVLADVPTYILAISIAAIAFNIINHVVIVAVTNPANVPLALVNYPFVILTELFLGYESMLRYEFGKVEWKERNVCIPVMHVTQHLPRN